MVKALVHYKPQALGLIPGWDSSDNLSYFGSNLISCEHLQYSLVGDFISFSPSTVSIVLFVFLSFAILSDVAETREILASFPVVSFLILASQEATEVCVRKRT